jgi:hypothetical protein
MEQNCLTVVQKYKRMDLPIDWHNQNCWSVSQLEPHLTYGIRCKPLLIFSLGIPA